MKGCLFSFFKKKEVIERKSLSVYISSQKEQIIIAPRYMDRRKNITFEQEKCFVYEFPSDHAIVGKCLKDSLDLFFCKDEIVKGGKKSDWSAYKHSKCNTIKSFEKEYITIKLEWIVRRNSYITIEGCPVLNGDLSVTSAISYHWDNSELAKRVLLVYEACKKLLNT